MLPILADFKGMLAITRLANKKYQLFGIRENYIKRKGKTKVPES